MFNGPLTTICMAIIFSQSGKVATAWEERDDVLYNVLNGGNLVDTWEGAKQRCSNDDAILFSPADRTSEWIAAFLQEKGLTSVWIGVNDQDKTGEWVWPDLSLVNQTDMHWNYGEPTFRCPEHCVEVHNSGVWNNLPCSNSQPIVCQKCKPFDGGVDIIRCPKRDCRPGPADIIFLVDTSDSTNTSLSRMKNVMRYFITKLPIGPDDFQFAAIQYSFDASVVFDFKRYFDEFSIKEAIDNLKYCSGSTFTAKALLEAKMMFQNETSGSRTNSYRIIVLLYDGLSSDRSEVYVEAIKMRDARIQIMPIGLGPSVYHFEVSNVAYRNDFVFTSELYKDAVNRLLASTIPNWCGGCVLYTQTDIIILLDVKRNQSLKGFLSRRSLIRTLLDYLLHENPDTQVGMLTYSDHSDFVYKLGWSSDLDKLISSSLSVEMDSISISANTTHALEFVDDSGFMPSNSGRISTRKIVLLLSDANWDDSDEIHRKVLDLQNKGIVVVGIVSEEDVSIDTLTSVIPDPSQVIYIPKYSNTDPYHSLFALTTMTSFYSCNTDIFN